MLTDRSFSFNKSQSIFELNFYIKKIFNLLYIGWKKDSLKS